MTTPIAQERFGDWLLLARRHLGPFSEVFVARPVARQDSLCVVKRVLPGARDDLRVRAEFEREARLLASLDDPRFPRLLDRGERHGLPFLVLSFLPGPTVRALATVSAGRSADPAWTRVVLALGLDALEGLAVLHRRSPAVVHRDVSPENLLVSPSGAVAVLDLGVAFEDSGEPDAPVGKRAYMSPEQREGSVVDARADLYALGVVLWELLAGARPHERFDGAGRLPLLKDVAPGVDPAAARWVARLTRPARDDRPATAAAALKPLRAWLRCAGVTAPRAVVAATLERVFSPAERTAWTPDPGAWVEAHRLSAEERGEETTDRQPGVPDITQVVDESPTR